VLKQKNIHLFMALAPNCHLWRAPLYNIFPHFLTNGTIFEKNY